jgi:hypothetical protein
MFLWGITVKNRFVDPAYWAVSKIVPQFALAFMVIFGKTHPTFSFPSTFKVLLCAPKLMEPPTPPTLRQMEHRHNYHPQMRIKHSNHQNGFTVPDTGQGCLIAQKI